jgi:hypothetical protein
LAEEDSNALELLEFRILMAGDQVLALPDAADVDLCALRHVPMTCVQDLAGRLVCQKKKTRKRPAATLLELAPRSRH